MPRSSASRPPPWHAASCCTCTPRQWTTASMLRRVLVSSMLCIGSLPPARGEPLTKALLAHIQQGTRDASEVTSIPAFEFKGYGHNITLGAMPQLQSVGEYAFDGMKGVLQIDAKDCKQLTTISRNSFAGIHNPASTITFGALPRLSIIGLEAFQETNALLTIDTGDCADLATIGNHAFYKLSNPNSAISFGALPKLKEIGEFAFFQIPAKASPLLSINGGDCPALTTISQFAFASASNPASSISFGALPNLATLGSNAFRGITGLLTVDAGDCSKLTAIGSNAFAQVSNPASTIRMSNLIKLKTVFAGNTFDAFGGQASLSGPFESYDGRHGPCVNLGYGVPGTGVHQTGEVPLTRALAANEGGEINTTCIPHYEFAEYDQSVTLGAMPRLKSIGMEAFRKMKGVLRIDAGDCTELTAISSKAFYGISNPASTISFGALPKIKEIGTYAFSTMKALLTINGGACTELAKIYDQAFSYHFNPATTISFGALPKLSQIGSDAFASMAGVLTIDAGDCPALRTIDSQAYYNVLNPNSTISFGALPQLKGIGSTAFAFFKGVLTMAAGDCTELATIGTQAFHQVSNPNSAISFGALPKLASVAHGTFSQMKGVLAIDAGECSHLIYIGHNAFDGVTNPSSTISFGALPKLKEIGNCAFQSMSGVLKLDAGNCEELHTIGIRAFSDLHNATSAVSLGTDNFNTLPKLRAIGSYAFLDMIGKVAISCWPCSELSRIDTGAFQGTSHPESSATFRNLVSLARAIAGSFDGFAGDALLSGPFTSWTGPCTNLGAPGTMIHAVDEILLTQERYAAIAEGIQTAAAIVCVPDDAFKDFSGNIALGAMPRLTYIGMSAFEFEGNLTLEAGDCPALATIGSRAFYKVTNPASTISFGALPNLKTIGTYAFYRMQGVLTINAGDVTKLTTISSNAFSGIANIASVISFGALPNLIEIGPIAFYQMQGLLTIDAGDCNELLTIRDDAFSADLSISNPNSTISFGALPKLTTIGERAFYQMQGVLTIKAGDCTELSTISDKAFFEVSNPALTISFGKLPQLNKVGEGAFKKVKGVLAIKAGDVTKLTRISVDAFSAVSNPASTISLGALPNLVEVGSSAFCDMKGVLQIDAGDLTKLIRISANAFNAASNQASTISLGALPNLVEVGSSAFCEMKGVLRIDAGDCLALSAFGGDAFSGISNPDSSISFGALPTLQRIKDDAFRGMEGVLTIHAGDCEKLDLIGHGVFRGVSSPASSISFGALPKLRRFDMGVFSEMAGVLTIEARDCNELTTISIQAFNGMSNPDSTVSFGALPKLNTIGSSAFTDFTGVLKMNAGDCSELATINERAFAGISNSASTVSFGALPKLQSIGMNAFANFAGVLKMSVGDCIELTTIPERAFYDISNPASTVSFGALPRINAIESGAFHRYKGLLTIEAGQCNDLTSIGQQAFCEATNLASNLLFSGLSKLQSIGDSAFQRYLGNFALQFERSITNSVLSSVGDSAFDGASNGASSVNLPADETESIMPELVGALIDSNFNGSIWYGLSTTSTATTTTATATTTTMTTTTITATTTTIRRGTLCNILHDLTPGHMMVRSPAVLPEYAATSDIKVCNAESFCRYHCCAAAVTNSGCVACSHTDGSCIEVLAASRSFATAAAASIRAASGFHGGWPSKLTNNQKATIHIPFDKKVYANATLQRGTSIVSWPDPDRAKKSGAEDRTSKYMLRWGSPKLAAGSTAPTTASLSDAYVGKTPPLNGLTSANKGNDPGLVNIDPSTGQIVAVPVNTGNYTMWVIAQDVDAVSGAAIDRRNVPLEYDQVVLAVWQFEVAKEQEFKLKADPTEPAELKGADVGLEEVETVRGKIQYAMGSTVKFEGVVGNGNQQATKKEDVFENPANFDFKKIAFKRRFVVNIEPGTAESTDQQDASEAADASSAASPGLWLVDSDTGEMLAQPKTAGNYTVQLVATDGGGAELVVRNWSFEVLLKDTDVPEFGPGGKDCANNASRVDDANIFNKEFTCSCLGTNFHGANCEKINQAQACPEPNEVVVDDVCKPFQLATSRDGNRAATGGDFTDPKEMESTYYTVQQFENYRIAPLAIDDARTNYSSGGESDVTYTVLGAPDGFFLNTKTGQMLGTFANFPNKSETKTFNITLQAIDKNGAQQDVETMQMRVRYPDDEVEAFGPHGKPCENNGTAKKDESRFDQKYTCDCTKIYSADGTSFSGDNCEVITAAPAPSFGSKGDGAAVNVGIGVGVGLIAVFASILIIYKVREYRIKMKPKDFMQQYRDMVDSGAIHPENPDNVEAKSKVPREIKRSHLTLVEVVGKGQFGQVWKAVLDESAAGGPPGYLVAAKTVLNSKVSIEASKELESEALVMAQVDHHPNLVSLVGVVTRGDPLVLIVGYCEHGSLLEMLRARAGESDPLSLPLKLRLCLDAAKGMNHLVKMHFIHRDLAARNVLVATGNVGKVADFGLSRGTNLQKAGTEGGEGGDGDGDGAGESDYYRSQAGVFPIRWTAPEAMETLKFSAASDVWSFAIVMVEVFQDGTAPYAELKNAVVMQKVMAGYKHPRPSDCNAGLYEMLSECWELDPKNRPPFSRVVDVLDFNCKKVNNESPSAATIRSGGVSVKHIQRMRSTGSLTSALSATIAETAFDGGASSTAGPDDGSEPHVESAYEYQGAVNIMLKMAAAPQPPSELKDGKGAGGGPAAAAGAVHAGDVDADAYEMPDGFNPNGDRPAHDSSQSGNGSVHAVENDYLIVGQRNNHDGDADGDNENEVSC